MLRGHPLWFSGHFDPLFLSCLTKGMGWLFVIQIHQLPDISPAEKTKRESYYRTNYEVRDCPSNVEIANPNSGTIINSLSPAGLHQSW